MLLNKKHHLTRALELFKELRSSDKVALQLSKELHLDTSVNARTIRGWIAEIKGKQSNKQIEESETYKLAKIKKFDTKSKYILITSAQNATPINKTFLKNMEAYSEFLGGHIEVIPLRYKNPTSVFSDKKYDQWDPAIEKYLIANRHNLNSSITVIGDVKIQPTASNPLSGMEGLTALSSSIFGHPRQHLVVVPTLENYPIKSMVTTGSVTRENYTDSKSGKKGEFHHTLGFVIVEIKDDEVFFMRQVSASKSGAFYDLDFKVEEGKVTQDPKAVSAVVFGDLHLGDHCQVSLDCSYGMLERFKPKNLILHDIMNGHSVSHHERKNPFIQLEREDNNTNDIAKELRLSINFLEKVLKYNPVIVKSNHDDFVDRWLIDVDWRKESNKSIYLHYAGLKASGQLPNGILPYEVNKIFKNKVKCLSETDSFIVRGVEVGQHGHLGSGGSRGSAEQFRKLNTRMVTAHTHSPMRKDGFGCVGTLTKLRLVYNKGLSNWANSNMIIHNNGKFQNLFIIKGEYTTLVDKI